MSNRLDEYGDIGERSQIGSRRAGFSLGNMRTFSSLKNPVYRFYYLSMLGQMAAMNMEQMARSLLIYRLTSSAAILGFMGLAFAVPLLCLSLFGGVIADRVQKKHVMFVGQLVSAIISVGIGLTLDLGYINPENPDSWWVLFAVGVLHGAIMGLMMPSRQAILPEIVGGEQLMNAISLNTMGANVLRIFAPAFTGFFIDAFDFAAVYYIIAGFYVLSAILIGFLPRTSAIVSRRSNALADLKAGLSYIRRDTLIIILLVITLVGTILAMPYQMLLPIFTEDILKVEATGMGTLMSVSGIGAIAGSITLASLPNKKRGLMLLIGCVILGIALSGFSFSSSWPLSLGLIVFVGLGQTGHMTLSNTLVQYYVDVEYRGRVMSFMMMQFGLMGFATFAAGLLAEATGVQWAVGGFAMALLFMSVIGLVFVPRIRNLD